MRVVLQRVQHATVVSDNNQRKSIGQGLLVLLGIDTADNDEDIQWLTQKIAALRIFDDENGVMNRSLLDINGELLLVSQFTLHAATKKGNRPSYIKAARPEIALPLYEKFIINMEIVLQKSIKTGVFGAMMQVTLCNDGPVTIIIDSKEKW
jgi:D-tyrosyl-tRNA(Tyr) deacylase